MRPKKDRKVSDYRCSDRIGLRTLSFLVRTPSRFLKKYTFLNFHVGFSYINIFHFSGFSFPAPHLTPTPILSPLHHSTFISVVFPPLYQWCLALGIFCPLFSHESWSKSSSCSLWSSWDYRCEAPCQTLVWERKQWQSTRGPGQCLLCQPHLIPKSNIKP